MTYKPLNDLLLVEKVSSEETKQTTSGIILPTENTDSVLTRLRVLKVGHKVEVIKTGDIVLAENMFQKIRKDNESLGLINQKYVHVIEEQDE